MYAYIDESGDLGKSNKSSKNFILTAIIVQNEDLLPRISRKIFTRKVIYKNKVNQLHANKDTNIVRKAMIKEINKIDYEIVYRNNKNYMIALQHICNLLKTKNVNIIYLAMRDSRKDTMTKIDNIGKNLGIKIIQSNPIKEKGLQVADFVSWSIYKYIEYGDDEYYRKLNIETQ